jgi:hypothetical protein
VQRIFKETHLRGEQAGPSSSREQSPPPWRHPLRVSLHWERRQRNLSLNKLLVVGAWLEHSNTHSETHLHKELTMCILQLISLSYSGGTNAILVLY